METIPRNDFDMRNRYDAFCKAVLRNEAKNYLSEMARHRDREKSLEALTQQELDKLSTVDHYPSDSYVFSSHGYDLRIDNELVAEAFASLPEQEQSILVLHCVLDMADGEIGSLMGMSRSAVQRHRTSTLKQLRLRYYEGYINKLCTRTLYDSNGFPYVCVDEYMKRRLEIKLIHSIVVALE